MKPTLKSTAAVIGIVAAVVTDKRKLTWKRL